ncbi:MAG TPA: class I SAM-dependent methyltransferase [Thermoanaerobaculia bacterium]|nr:class I SAM-dependent methyltransferase [Thermoanaerobaculia bacterium]
MTQTAAEFWDRQAQAAAPVYWAEYPLVRRYVNECVTECWWAYPTHGFKAAWAYRPLPRGLSIGCGTGLLEKDLRWMRICEEVDAYDISPESIRLARERALREGIDGVTYEVADCERFDYPEARYDAVFFNGSMHHISDPAALLDRLLVALKPKGLLFLDDYVGPSRDEWSDAHLVHAHEAYAALPRQWRTVERLAPPYDASDPSEMIASSSILPAVHARFDILWEKPYWGNLLYPVLSQVAANAGELPDAEGILGALIEREQALVAAGAFAGPLFTWLVGEKPSP